MINRSITVYYLIYIIFIGFFFYSCSPGKNPDLESHETELDSALGRFISGFEGRGDLTDDSNPLLPEDAISRFKLPDEFQIELISSEPDIFQPLEIQFDYRGRMWVVQYSQYPYPEGLKVTAADHHLRLKFDQVPAAPPHHTPGADKIVFYTDENSDGRFEKQHLSVTGLNICTSVLWGGGKIWVLNPPYLLAYPDEDGNGIPEGDPVVHLEGFGLEDTHAVANSLTWGPDGWIYGAQGSTTTARIRSKASPDLYFQGQGIWRYHPTKEIFELFAEGGGNTFDIEWDSQGRLYSGDNGTDRGMYYKQGAYYTKNWGKHGAHTNKYSYGYLSNMVMSGEKKRFTHAWIKYEGGLFPALFQEKMFAINPLFGFIQLTEFEQIGSNFKTNDLSPFLTSADTWFRPVDIKAGPEGAIYIADWYDSRLSHVDPRDTWHKTSGRIYRIIPKNSDAGKIPDLTSYTHDQLMEQFRSGDKWMKQNILRLWSDQKALSLLADLKQIFQAEKGPLSLDLLWAINLLDGLDSQVINSAFVHSNPFVRLWTIRLCGDFPERHPDIFKQLQVVSREETHPEVRSQLAASLKRFSGDISVPIIGIMLQNSEDANDPHIPLQLWWAMESKIDQFGPEIIELYQTKSLWSDPLSQKFILSRLAKRLIQSESEKNMDLCAQLLRLAPDPDLTGPVLDGISEGLLGRSSQHLSKSLVEALEPFRRRHQDAPLALELRQGHPEVIEKVLKIISDIKHSLRERLNYIQILGEMATPGALESLLNILHENHPSSIKIAVLKALQRYQDDTIGDRVLYSYPDKLRAEPAVRFAALYLLISKQSWCQKLLSEIRVTRKIDPGDLSADMIDLIELWEINEIKELIPILWPERQTYTEKQIEISLKKISGYLKSGKSGNAENGKKWFQSLCLSCHRLKDQGGLAGPDLNYYNLKNTKDLLVNIINPGAEIREGFQRQKIITDRNHMIVGKIKERSGNSLLVETAWDDQLAIPLSSVTREEPYEKSLMPYGLLDNLLQQDVIDLFTFLKNN